MEAQTSPQDKEKAYEYCVALTGKRESNFALGFPLLPEAKFKAIHVVYAFCRFLDDLSDESSPEDAKQLLAQWQEELHNIYDRQKATHPISIALLDTLKTFKIPKEGFQDLMDGCVQDQSIKRYKNFKELTGYCDMVATSIAKVSLPVYGFKYSLALMKCGRDLSFAFQLTNILRDVAEDIERGRVYIPEEDFKKFGLSPEAVLSKKKPKAILELFAFEGKRCEEYFKSGAHVLKYLDADSRPCVNVMWGVYHTLMEKILKDPLKSLDAQTELTAADKEEVLKKYAHDTNR